MYVRLCVRGVRGEGGFFAYLRKENGTFEPGIYLKNFLYKNYSSVET